jgi:hypothetical protein
MERIGEITVWIAMMLVLALCALGLVMFSASLYKIRDCQKELPRTQVCKLEAIPQQL